MSLKLNFKKALELIQRSQRIFLTTHVGDDGDDLGAMQAIYQYLKQSGKDAVMGLEGGVPNNLLFMPLVAEIGPPFKNTNTDLLITFGCNRIERTGQPLLQNFKGPMINFDHHPDNTNFGTVNVVDPQMAAVAQLAYYFLQYVEAEIDQKIATCLLTGIFTDTGGFKHANTTAEVFEVAAELLKRGARIDRIAFETFGKKRPQALKAWAKGLENTRYDAEKRMVFSVLTENDLKEIGATDEDLNGFTELLNNLPQAKFALLLRQDGDVVRGSLRSEPHKKVDVSKIAKSFGGGGHKLAAGFKVKGRLKRSGSVWQIE